jgi:hypothetical protein
MGNGLGSWRLVAFQPSDDHAGEGEPPHPIVRESGPFGVLHLGLEFFPKAA